jgi:hypothetical protein
MGTSSRMHQCAAVGCYMTIYERFLMCHKHWNLVPRDLQDLVTARWDDMQRGNSARQFLIARLRAVIAVAALEGGEIHGLDIELTRLRSSENIRRPS